MMLNYIVWDVNPEIFEIGNFAIRWYGLLFAFSFLVGFFAMQRMFKNEGVPLKLLDSLTTYMVVGTIVGARLGHCLFYQPKYYLSHPVEILKIWEGGLASHGAAIGIMIAVYLFARKYKVTYLWTLDRIVTMTALGGFFIRMGNLFNSEIYGVATDLPWGFIFVSAGEQGPRHPTQLYEGLAYLAIFVVLITIYYKSRGKPREGLIFGLFFLLVFLARFIVEFVKEPQVGFEQEMMLNMGQLLSIPLILFGVYLIYRSGKLKSRQ
jgi:phosphatidylglycerol:prolipoprotein diacylglycerol transferase